MIVRRTMARAALAFGGVGLAGCYTFAPVAPASLAAGSRLRVRLTGPGAAALAPVLGTSVAGVDGQLVRRAGDTLVVRPTSLDAGGGVDVAWTGVEIAIPSSWATSVERRRLSVARTTLLAGGGVAAAIAIVELARGGGEHGGNDGPSGTINLGRGVR